MSHLTDDEIQEYLDSPEAVNVQTVQTHLHNCQQCRQQLTLYRQVFSVLIEEPETVVPYNFAGQITERLMALQNKKYHKWELLLLLFSIIQGIALTIYFVDFGKIIFYLSRLQTNFFTVFHKANAGFLPILFFAVIIVIFYGFLEKILNRLKGSHLLC
ncbi:MAG TPA: hypothetical protein ENH29_10435 [Bacteroidetes bacterium]|nr:hypothetical protein [Bacteroidota bacterium]